MRERAIPLTPTDLLKYLKSLTYLLYISQCAWQLKWAQKLEEMKTNIGTVKVSLVKMADL